MKIALCSLILSLLSLICSCSLNVSRKNPGKIGIHSGDTAKLFGSIDVSKGYGFL